MKPKKLLVLKIRTTWSGLGSGKYPFQFIRKQCPALIRPPSFWTSNWTQLTWNLNRIWYTNHWKRRRGSKQDPNQVRNLKKHATPMDLGCWRRINSQTSIFETMKSSWNLCSIYISVKSLTVIKKGFAAIEENKTQPNSCLWQIWRH